jgi:hypothetical protein
METHFERIKSNLREAAISSADLVREAEALDKKIKVLQPEADNLSQVVEQVRAKQVELAEAEQKLGEAVNALAALRKQIS